MKSTKSDMHPSSGIISIPLLRHPAARSRRRRRRRRRRCALTGGRSCHRERGFTRRTLTHLAPLDPLHDAGELRHVLGVRHGYSWMLVGAAGGRWSDGENRRESTAAAAANAQNDKLERGRERPPGEERRCSDLHHPSLQPSLPRAGCFLPHGSDFPPVCFILGRKLRPRLLYYLLLPSTSPLCGRDSFCVVVFLNPSNLWK